MTDEEQIPEENFAELFEAYMPSQNRHFKVGDKISGRVVSIGQTDIILSTGTKRDGVVSREELEDENGVLSCQEGDEIELYVVSTRDNTLHLSRAVSGGGGLDTLQDAFSAQLPVQGKVSATCKGGFNIDIMQRRAFCPISQIDARFVEDGESYVGQSFDFVITSLEQGGRNIVVSRRRLLEKEAAEASRQFQEEVSVGDTHKGRIVRLEKFGVFVELVPGVEGMVHISEMSWSRIHSPQELVSVDDQVNVKILKMEKDEKSGRMRIALSMKQAQPDPWDFVESKLKTGDTVSGKVTRCTSFGAFVELFPGIEGLIHISELSYVKRINRPEDVVTPGQQVSVVVKEIDMNRQRIGLSLREVEGDPWQKVMETCAPGQIVDATLEKKEQFGWFITLQPGVVGLLPLSRLAGADKKSEMEKLQPGDKIQVRIESIQAGEKRISLHLAGGDNDGTEQNWKEHVKPELAASQSFGSLGAKLQQALQNR